GRELGDRLLGQFSRLQGLQRRRRRRRRRGSLVRSLGLFLHLSRRFHSAFLQIKVRCPRGEFSPLLVIVKACRCCRWYSPRAAFWLVAGAGPSCDVVLPSESNHLSSVRGAVAPRDCLRSGPSRQICFGAFSRIEAARPR